MLETSSRAEKPVQEWLSLCSKLLCEEKSQSKSDCLYARNFFVSRKASRRVAVSMLETSSQAEKPVQEWLSLCSKLFREQKSQSKSGRLYARNLFASRKASQRMAISMLETFSRAEKPVQEWLSLCSKPFCEQKSQSKSDCLYARNFFASRKASPRVAVSMLETSSRA